VRPEHLRDQGDVLDPQAALGPVGRRDAHEQRTVVGPHRADRVGDLDEQPGAVLERAAVLVGPRVRQRRQELVEQVPVRGVQLDDVEPCGQRAPGSRGERTGQVGDLGGAQGGGCGAPGERERGRADRGPAAVGHRDRAVSCLPVGRDRER